MNMFKKNGGFTLVELIVVIAILAILAGVAVPAYSGYIEKANSAADIVALDAVKTAVQAAHATTTQPSAIVVTDNDSGTDSITVGGVEMEGEVLKDFQMFYMGNAATAFSIDLKTGKTASWDGTTWTITK